MDHIDAYLATASLDLKRAPAIRGALALGKSHLDKYYDMTDHSEVYRIAMSECCSPDNLSDYISVHQSYIHDTSFSISVTPNGTASGSSPRPRLSTMSLSERMQAAPSMRLPLLARIMCVTNLSSLFLH